MLYILRCLITYSRFQDEETAKAMEQINTEREKGDMIPKASLFPDKTMVVTALNNTSVEIKGQK